MYFIIIIKKYTQIDLLTESHWLNNCDFIIFARQSHSKIKRQILICHNIRYWSSFLSDISYLYFLICPPILYLNQIISLILLNITTHFYVSFLLPNIHTIFTFVCKRSILYFIVNSDIWYFKIRCQLANSKHKITISCFVYFESYFASIVIIRE